MRVLTKLRIDEVSAVVKGANPGAQVLIRKSDDAPLLFDEVMKRRRQAQWVEEHYALRKAAVSDELRGPRDEDDSKKVEAKLRAWAKMMVVVDPSKTEEEHLSDFINTARGRHRAEHLNNLSKGAPMLDVSKLIPVLEEGLMARAKLTKRDGQTEAQAFAKLYENDIDFRKQWAIVTEAKMMMALSKSLPNMMSTTPTSTEVGNTGTADDSAEAVRLLSEMAEKQHRTFEQVFQDPDNAALAARTYTSHHRSSTSGSELQQR
jgi:hypothetical protein